MKMESPKMKSPLAAIVLAATTMTAAPVVAQDSGMAMEMSLSMLELAAQRELQQLGLEDVDVMSLTLSQLSRIRLATSQDDMDQSGQAAQVRNIVGED